MADTSGVLERAALETRLLPLCGGRIWKTAVPDDVVLPRFPDERIKPYIILAFAPPFASGHERGIGQKESAQPHVWTARVTVYGGDPDTVESTMKEVRALLIDWAASPTSTKLAARGGYSWTEKDTGSKPTRFAESVYLRSTLNLAS